MEDYSVSILSYNTERSHLHIPEYGRNVQNMINYAKQLPTKEERNLAAHAIIEVMGQLNPHLRDIEDYNHKLWTHLFVMSNFEIDVDSPYEIPNIEKLQERPRLMKYPTHRAKYGHFGYYTEEMIKVASQSEDEEEKEYFAELFGNLLKKNYLHFHTENVENKAIVDVLKELSGGELKLEDENVLNSTKTILKQSGGVPKSQASKRRGKTRKYRK